MTRDPGTPSSAPLSLLPLRALSLVLLGALLAVTAEMSAAVPVLPLLGGGALPISGLGLCCRPSSTGEAVRKSVYDYLMMGGRHLDTAIAYHNAKEVGEGLRQALAEGVRREEVFVTTKIPGEAYGIDMATIVPPHLEEMGLGYVDLLLLHHPGTFTGDELARCGTPQRCWRETWLALEGFRMQGLVRHLGVSNFGRLMVEDVLSYATAPVAVNQIEYHPWVTDEHRATVLYCHARGIAITAYASLGSPHSRWGQIRKIGLNRPTTRESYMDRLSRIGSPLGKTWSQVLLRWAVQQNISVVPGTGDPVHMSENLDLFDWQLPAADMAFLDNLPEDDRGLVYSFFQLDSRVHTETLNWDRYLQWYVRGRAAVGPGLALMLAMTVVYVVFRVARKTRKKKVQ